MRDFDTARRVQNKTPELGMEKSNSSKEGSGFYIGHGRCNFIDNLDVFAKREGFAIHNRFATL
jgi:hypothetical protein